MSTIDIRASQEDVQRIIFSDSCDKGYGVAYALEKHHTGDFVQLQDGGEMVLISSKEHAANLIKALQKAIELGWLK